MKRHGISGIPVVERGAERRQGRLVGILTNRDVRFATNPAQPVSELMTKERLITVREGVSQDEAKRLLHQYRIEKLLVVDDHYRCIGLITVKDIEKAVAHPNACKDEQGRLRVAAATTVGRQGLRSAPSADRCRLSTSSSSTPRTAIRGTVLEAVTPGQEAVERRPGDRRQRRDAAKAPRR